MSDRRKIPRLGLNVPIILFPDDGEPLRTKTLNVSKDGFYCLVGRPLAPGARIRFRAALPHCGASLGSRMVLDGVVEVVRLVVQETTPDFAIGCRIEGYRAIRCGSD
jgi:hypothetical protein